MSDMESGRPETTSSAAAAAAAPTPVATASGGRQDAGGPRETPPSATTPKTLNQIRQPCLMNMEYHAAREAWLDQLHRWLMFLVIAAGASAFIDAWPPFRILGPVVSVIAGALDLTFDLSNRARGHAMIRRRYADVLAEATRSPDSLNELQAKLDEISGEEEPVYNALMAQCADRAEKMVHGSAEKPCKINFSHRTFANIFHFSGRDFF